MNAPTCDRCGAPVPWPEPVHEGPHPDDFEDRWLCEVCEEIECCEAYRVDEAEREAVEDLISCRAITRDEAFGLWAEAGAL